MFSLILQTTARFLLPMLLVFSVFLLLRGHHHPGGGFVGGLVAAAAFVLHLMANAAGETRRMLRVDPKLLIGIGLLVATLAGAQALCFGKPFMTAAWSDWQVPVTSQVGTPLLFDVGVYLSVLGTVLTIILTLVED